MKPLVVGVIAFSVGVFMTSVLSVIIGIKECRTPTDISPPEYNETRYYDHNEKMWYTITVKKIYL